MELYAAVVLKRRWSCYIPILQSQGRLQLVVANDLLGNVHLAVRVVSFHELLIGIEKTVKYEVIGLGEFLIEPFDDGVLFINVHVPEFLLRIEIFMHNFGSEVLGYCLSFILGHPLLMLIVHRLNVVLDTK